MADSSGAKGIARPGGMLLHMRAIPNEGRLHSLLVVVALGDDLHVVSHQKDRVETNPELSDEVDVASLLHLLQKGCTQAEPMSVHGKQAGS